MTEPVPSSKGSVSKGQHYRRKSDGKVFEVWHIGSSSGAERVQLRPAGAKNLKNTNWIWIENLDRLYDPADAPLPPSLAERVLAEMVIPEGASGRVAVTIRVDYKDGGKAVEFVRRYPGAQWRWMHVPANGDYWVLYVTGKSDGIDLSVDIPGGFTRTEGAALEANLKAARDDSQGENSMTPAPYAYREAPNAA